MKHTILLFAFAFLFFTSTTLKSQVAVNEGSTAPDPSAMLDVSSTGMGVLIPRMTGVQRDAIPSPATGLMVFTTGDNRFWVYNGTAWEKVLAGTDGGWLVSGDHLVALNTGNVGIGTDNPIGDLEIARAGSYLYESTDLRISLYSDGASAYPRINYLRSHSPVMGDITSAAAVTQDGDVLGRVSFGGIRVNGTGGSSSGAGWFEMVQKGATTTNGVPGQFRIVTADGQGVRTERMVINPDGKVGIGTTNPDTKLDVEGDLDMNGNQVKNFRVENRTSDPSNPSVGQIWIRTDL